MTVASASRRIVRPSEVAKIAGYEIFHERYVRRLIYERRIAFFKLGPGRGAPVAVDLDDLDALIEAGRHEPAEARR